MSPTTLIVLLAAAVVTAVGIGLLAGMEAREIVAQVAVLGGAALSMYGLVALLA